MILKNGLVVENNKLVKKDVLVVDGIIQEINDNIDGTNILDVTDLLIIPGAVDVHVHLREPGYELKETIKTGTLSSAKGGVTTVMAMPNLSPTPDNLDNLNIEKELIKYDSLVNTYPYGAVSVGQRGKEAADFANLCPNVYAITDDGVGVNNLEILEEAMKYAKMYDIVMASHAEDTVDSKLPQGEYVAVRREIEYAKRIGCKYHFCHLSTKESFDAIRKAKNEGYTNITCEVSPHHLFLNSSMIKDGNWKMNPPLRSEENRLETIKALLDGTACMVASDHAPHSEIEKSQEYSKCPNGIIGIETMLPIVYTYFIDKGLATHKDFINWFITNPSKVFNLKEKKIEINEEADLVALDINTTRKYTKEEILSKSTNAPYIGMEFKGFPILTILKDKIVWRMNYEK